MDRSHYYAMSILDPSFTPPHDPHARKLTLPAAKGAVKGKDDKDKGKKREKQAPLSAEEKEERAAAMKIKAAEKVARRQAKELKEAAKAAKAAKRQAKVDAAAASEAEAKKLATQQVRGTGRRGCGEEGDIASCWSNRTVNQSNE